MADTALLTSMIYHMGRIASPDINAKPGALEGIRRNDAIHVYVAMFFDNRTVALRPGVFGIQLAMSLKPLNERLRPLYDAYRCPTGFSNRLCLRASCLTWGGRSKKDEWVATESEFCSWSPRDFDKLSPPLWAGHRK